MVPDICTPPNLLINELTFTILQNMEPFSSLITILVSFIYIYIYIYMAAIITVYCCILLYISV